MFWYFICFGLKLNNDVDRWPRMLYLSFGGLFFSTNEVIILCTLVFKGNRVTIYRNAMHSSPQGFLMLWLDDMCVLWSCDSMFCIWNYFGGLYYILAKLINMFIFNRNEGIYWSKIIKDILWVSWFKLKKGLRLYMTSYLVCLMAF